MTKVSDDRAARLAAQLRANLRKRKEQVRGVSGAPTEPADQASSDDPGPSSRR